MIEQFFDTMIVAVIDNEWKQWHIKIYVLESAENRFQPPWQ